MRKLNIGFIHPGTMGISLAASAQATGHAAYWVSTNRSQETRQRAEKYGLVPTTSIDALCEKCSIIISVCPPHAAMDVAREVLDASFSGIYADVNAIAPEKTKAMSELMASTEIDFVDGGIVGGPAWHPDSTWLYLSGKCSNEVAECFIKGPLETHVIDDEIGKASAVKMSFAAYTKGTTALLCAILATADELGVRDELELQWSRNGSDFAQKAQDRMRNVTAKAWRFTGEMEEIAETFNSVGLPPGFHRASQDIYERISDFKGANPKPSVEEVLAALKNDK